LARVLNAWGVPTKKDLDALSHRVAELAATTKKLSKQTERRR